MGETTPSTWLNTAPQWVIFTALAMFAARWLWSWWTERRKTGTESTSTAVTDAATANATLVQALDEARKLYRDEREDNRAKDARIDVLEARIEEYREQIVALQDDALDMARQLDQLRRRLDDLPKL